MDVDLASKIVSIRPAIEALIIQCTQDPNQIVNRPPANDQLCNLIRLLSDQQLEHVLCEKINDNNQQSTNSRYIGFSYSIFLKIENLFLVNRTFLFNQMNYFH